MAMGWDGENFTGMGWEWDGVIFLPCHSLVQDLTLAFRVEALVLALRFWP